jgi:DivIVA domain-containing protein
LDGHSIERIRNASFALSVRGYDRHEVDRFLSELADWLEINAGEAARSEATRAQLERVAEQTAGILNEAHEAAESIREDAAKEARQHLVDANLTAESVRSSAGEYSEEAHEQADAYARKTRGEADEYARDVHAEAEAEAEELKQAARREAERTAEEASTRLREIESVITGLEQRRDGVLAELERLASGIGATATKHRGQPGRDEGEPIDGVDVAGGEEPSGEPEQGTAAATPSERITDPAEDETTEREAVSQPAAERQKSE